jgi:hypothetical protein
MRDKNKAAANSCRGNSFSRYSNSICTLQRDCWDLETILAIENVQSDGACPRYRSFSLNRLVLSRSQKLRDAACARRRLVSYVGEAVQSQFLHATKVSLKTNQHKYADKQHY